MLHITPEAGLAIQKLADDQGVRETGGLRIATTKTPELALSVAAQPTETDVVVTEETTGARVILDPLTAEQVSDRSLDVADTVESTARFQIGDQGVTDD